MSAPRHPFQPRPIPTDCAACGLPRDDEWHKDQWGAPMLDCCGHVDIDHWITETKQGCLRCDCVSDAWRPDKHDWHLPEHPNLPSVKDQSDAIWIEAVSASSSAYTEPNEGADDAP